LNTDVVAASRPASAHDLAVLRHPDRKTTWVQIVAATLREPVFGLARRCDERLRELNPRVPVVGARLRDETWVLGPPPQTIEVSGEPLDAPMLLDRFDLTSEPPIRLIVSGDGRRLALAAHHAGLDGRGIVHLIQAILGGPVPPAAADARATNRGAGSTLTPLKRLLRPADRIAPSPVPPTRDSLAVRTLDVAGHVVVARIVAAAIDAISEHNRARGWPWRRIGLSIPVGPSGVGIGNAASYRRVDLRPGDNVRRAVATALKSGPLPPEFTSAPRALRLLSPIAYRFSDSLLVSNHGRCDLPGLSRLEIFPVARGRSAVVFGSAGVAGGESTLSVRARDLTREDAEGLLDQAVGRLEGRRE
jgi:hypothetical protein